MTKLIVVVGPTAVGKTQLGIELAQRFNGEIISGDSMQIYRKLDIGTAKPTREEQAQAIHHLIDIKAADENFSAHDFVELASEKIQQITASNHLPIIVGGTGLYIQSLLEGYHLGGGKNHQLIQNEQLELENSSLTNNDLWQVLNQLNPSMAQMTAQNNRRRLSRKIALVKYGVEINNLQPDFEAKIIGLNTERTKLYQRINQRVDLMLEAGVLAEAEWLANNYPNSQAAQAIGYKEFFPYFSGEIELAEAVELVKRNSRRYAKRQLTWFRNRMAVNFWDLIENPAQMVAIEQEIEAWL